MKDRKTRRKTRLLKDNDVIDETQLMQVLILAIMGVGIVSLPREVADIWGASGWMLIILGGLLAIVQALIITTLAKRFPNKTFPEYGRDIAGRFIGTGAALLIAVYFIIVTAFQARITGDVIKLFLLFNTPIEVIIVAMMAVVLYLVRNGIEPIGRIATIILPILVFGALLLLIPAFSGADFSNLLPLVPDDIPAVFRGIAATSFSFLGYESMLLLLPFTVKSKGLNKTVVKAIGAVILIYVVIYIIVLIEFGVVETKSLIWPLFSLMKAVEIPGAFVERLEGVFLSLWVLAVFTTMMVTYFCAYLTLGKIIGLKQPRILAVPLFPVIYILAMIPRNVVVVYEYLKYFSTIFGVMVAAVIPIIFLILAVIRKKRDVHV
jgi:spore germination protein